MQKFIPKEKQQKKLQEQINKAHRTVVGFNTGTRVHKTDKHPSRARAKELARKYDER